MIGGAFYSKSLLIFTVNKSVDMEKIKVMIFEDDAVYMDAIITVIQNTNDLAIVGQYYTAFDVINHVKKQIPDVILMDIELPVRSNKHNNRLDSKAGLKCILALTDEFGNNAPKIIILTNFGDEERVFSAFCLGSVGYLIKNQAAIDDLPKNIRKAFREELFFNRFLAAKTMEFLRTRIWKKHAQILTPRQFEILALIRDYGSYEKVAQEAEIKLTTLKEHLKNIKDKLEVKTKEQAYNKIWFNRSSLIRGLRKDWIFD